MFKMAGGLLISRYFLLKEMAPNIVKKFKSKKVFGRMKKKDQEAFTEAYDQNVSDIYRFVYFKVGSKDEAEDITSAIFLKTWNHIQNNTLEDAKTLRALLYKVARTTIIDHYRSQGGYKKVSIDSEDNNIEIPIEDNKEEKLDIETEYNYYIKDKLPLLKEEYKEIIIMRFINELELSEIADVTGKSRGNIRVILHRALKALKDLIDEDEKKREKEEK